MKYLKNNCWQFLLFATLSCLMIWKALLLPNCFAFDANDERNHTFVNLKAAKDILLQGEFPFMNFYNNFGTPLIGDGLTFPFSPLALTHYLLPGYLSMTINRGVTFFFVLLVAFYFFSTFFPKRIATFVSVLVVFQPAFLWHAAHHHYQLSLGLFLLFMICLVKVYQGALNNREFYGAMFVLSIMLLLSVSMNIVLLILFYLLICAFILLWNNNRRIFLTMGAAIAAGLLCTGFEIVLFFENFFESSRSSDFYSQQFQLTLKDVLLVSIGQQKEWTHYIGWSYFSLPVLLMGTLGCRQLLSNSENKVWGTIVLTLGIVPVLVVFFLLGNQELWWKIPILRNTDIQRFYWMSNVFIVLAAGFWIQSFLDGKVKREEIVFLICLSFGLIVVLDFAKVWGRFLLDYKLGIYLWMGILLISLIQIKKIEKILPKLYPILFSVLVAFIIFPMLNTLLQFRYPGQCGTNHLYSPKENAYFVPHNLLDGMEPNVRMVSQYAHLDLTAIERNVLGGNGRSIILNKKLTSFLFKEDLIDGYQKTPLAYVFKPPWKLELLNLLGIRYLLPIGESPMVSQGGWRRKLSSPHKSPTTGDIEPLVLYENPRKVTPVYLLDDKGEQIFLQSYKFIGNTLEANLPDVKSAANLVFTFTNGPHWKVRVNQEERPVNEGSLPFVMTRILPGDQHISLEYQPFTKMQVLLFLFGGISLFVFVLILDHCNSNRKPLDPKV